MSQKFFFLIPSKSSIQGIHGKSETFRLKQRYYPIEVPLLYFEIRSCTNGPVSFKKKKRIFKYFETRLILHIVIHFSRYVK